jgi:hypothetical protein
MHIPVKESRERAPTMRPLPHLEEAWRMRSGGGRLDAVEKAAPRLKEAIESSGVVLAVRTLEIARFPYPTKYAFAGATSVAPSYVWMFNRAVLVEYRDLEGQRRRMLVNPTRPEGARKAPYFRKIYGLSPKSLEKQFERIIGKRKPKIPEQLQRLGVSPNSIDYITFDHLHVQEIGPMLGPSGEYASASLVVTEEELAAARNLHPLQRFWYVEGALDGVAPENIQSFDRDVLLGEGLALVRTPGHTDGNHTIVMHFPSGLMTISENGVAAECYAPHMSKIPGIADHARRTGEKVILNANSRERTLDQYTSMRLEAILAEPRERDAFPRHFSSSELTRTLLAPGVRPSFVWESVTHGTL